MARWLNPTEWRRNASRAWVILAVLALATPTASWAGRFALAWDPVPDQDLAGYRIYIGTSPGAADIALVEVPPVNAVTLTTLPDCTPFYVGVKAYDYGGLESQDFGGFLQGMPQPEVGSFDPSLLEQGEVQVTVRVAGVNFTPEMTRTSLSFDDPDLRVVDLQYLSCTEIEAVISAGPYLSQPSDPDYNGAGGAVEDVPPVEIGTRQVSVSAGDGSGAVVVGPPMPALDVDFLVSRADMDGNGRVDGYDLALLSRGFGASAGTSDRYEGRLDLNGDKSLDGIDLALLADLFALQF